MGEQSCKYLGRSRLLGNGTVFWKHQERGTVHRVALCALRFPIKCETNLHEYAAGGTSRTVALSNHGSGHLSKCTLCANAMKKSLSCSYLVIPPHLVPADSHEQLRRKDDDQARVFYSSAGLQQSGWRKPMGNLHGQLQLTHQPAHFCGSRCVMELTARKEPNQRPPQIGKCLRALAPVHYKKKVARASQSVIWLVRSKITSRTL